MTTKTLLAAMFALFFASSASAQVLGDVKVDATVPGLKANVSATTSVNDNGDNGSSTGVSGVLQTSTSSGDDGIEALVITRSDVTVDDSVAYDPADISTSAAFSAYARSIMSADENIVKVESDKDEVSIWYKEPGEFLGFISVTVTTRATVTADGEIEIDRPWYSAFVSSEQEATLENSLGSTAGTIARAEGSTELSANAQARLLNALRASMKMHYDSTVTAGTSTDEASY